MNMNKYFVFLNIQSYNYYLIKCNILNTANNILDQ